MLKTPIPTIPHSLYRLVDSCPQPVSFIILQPEPLRIADADVIWKGTGPRPWRMTRGTPMTKRKPHGSWIGIFQVEK